MSASLVGMMVMVMVVVMVVWRCLLCSVFFVSLFNPRPSIGLASVTPSEVKLSYSQQSVCVAGLVSCGLDQLGGRERGVKKEDLGRGRAGGRADESVKRGEIVSNCGHDSRKLSLRLDHRRSGENGWGGVC